MDKRKEENLRVKKSITDTLFALMAKKSLTEIPITELTSKAGVARASFYRNYSSREDVIVTLIRDILGEYRKEMNQNPGTVYSFENVLLAFQYFYKYRNYILDLRRCGFTSVLMEELNRFHEDLTGPAPNAPIEKYKLYMYTGALMNTAVVWLFKGGQISAEDIARHFHDTVLKARTR